MQCKSIDEQLPCNDYPKVFRCPTKEGTQTQIYLFRRKDTNKNTDNLCGQFSLNI